MVDVIKIERRNVNVAAGITRFYSAYYISNALLLASYVFVRGWFLFHSDLKYSRLGFKEEIFPKVCLHACKTVLGSGWVATSLS